MFNIKDIFIYFKKCTQNFYLYTTGAPQYIIPHFLDKSHNL